MSQRVRWPGWARWGTRVGLGLGTALAVLAAGGHPAGAATGPTPDRTGWWSQAETLPTTVPFPTVPSGGLVVQEGPAGPTAYAAIHYSGLGSQSSGTLTLVVAQGSSVLPASLEACPVTHAWTGPKGPGAWSARPSYATVGCSSGTVAGDGSAAAFPISAPAGTLDLAIVPTPGSAPFSVTFDSPGAGALAISQPSAPAPLPSPAAAPARANPSAVAAPIPSASASTALGSSPSYVTPAASEPTPAVSSGSTGSASDATRSQVVLSAAPPVLHVLRASDHRAERAAGVMGLLILIGAWWFVGGRPARAPRLLGAQISAESDVGSAHVGTAGHIGWGPGTEHAGALRLAGVGRFARPRPEGRPQRL